MKIDPSKPWGNLNVIIDAKEKNQIPLPPSSHIISSKNINVENFGTDP